MLILEYINSSENVVNLTGLPNEDKEKYKLQNHAPQVPLQGSLPVIDVNLSLKKDTGFSGYKTLIKDFNIIHEKIKLQNPENINSYLDNLIALGLLYKPFGVRFAIKPIYNHLKEHQEIKKIERELGEEQKLNLVEGKIEMTSLCKAMLFLCSKKEKE